MRHHAHHKQGNPGSNHCGRHHKRTNEGNAGREGLLDTFARQHGRVPGRCDIEDDRRRTVVPLHLLPLR